MFSKVPERVKKKTKVLIINGVARSGKDTFIDALQETNQFYLCRYSIIDPIKALASVAGWEGDAVGKTDAGRRLLSDLKIATDKYNDFAFKTVMNWADIELATYSIKEKETAAKHGTGSAPPLLCIVSRELKDIPRFKETFLKHGISCRTIVIRNEEAEKNCPDNIADRNVLDCDYDLHYMNQGTKEEFVNGVKFMVTPESLSDNSGALGSYAPCLTPLDELEPMIVKWAEIRGIFDFGTLSSQLEKLREEVDELDEALEAYLLVTEHIDGERSLSAEQTLLDHVKMELGDVHVVATNIAKLANSSLTECGNMAYNKISKRKGTMQDGKYVKEAS